MGEGLVEVGFEAPEISDAQRPELEEVLRGVVVDERLAPAGTGRWPHQVERLTVRRRLAGARSGAEVLDVAVTFRDATRADRCVVKVDRAIAVEKEWTAFRTHVLGRAQAVITPVEAVSAFVLNGPPTGVTQHDRAAIVYRHVADWAGLPDQNPETLEAVAGLALDRHESTAAVRLLEGLLRRLSAALHEPTQVIREPRTLSQLNSSLGPDLVLEVDRIHPDGFPTFAIPLSDEIREMRRYPMDVLRAATRPPMWTEANATIAKDDRIRLDLVLSLDSSGRVLGRAHDISVEIRPVKSFPDGALKSFAGRSTPVIGRVHATRAGQHWDRIGRFLAGITASGPDRVTAGGVTVANPFVPLHAILTADVGGRVRATVHGDLNPRNILVLDGQVYLIDFATVTAGRPVLGDAAWLEMCLLRDVVAVRLDWPALVRLQRLLAAAIRLDPFTTDADDVGLAADESPVLRSAFEILRAIRRLAYDGYPATEHAGFARDYLEQISLAALRTLKWEDEDQDEAKIRAAVAVSGVAAEWLDGTEPCRYWPRTELERLVGAAGAGRATAPGFVDLVAAALRTLDRQGKPADTVTAAVDAARARLLATTYLTAAKEIVSNPPDGPGYIDLEAYVDPQDSTAVTVRGVCGSALDLVADLPEVVLVSGAGGGKTTLVDRLRFRLARAVCAASRDGTTAGAPARFPVLVPAGAIARAVDLLRQTGADHRPASVLAVAAGLPLDDGHLRVGAVHVTVDGFNELTDDDQDEMAAWVRTLRRHYPRTPVLVCHRSLGFSPGRFGFPVAELQPMTDDMARGYATRSFRATAGVAAYEKTDQLFALLGRPQYRKMRELTRNPLFLWLLVQDYARRGAEVETLPADVGVLFDQLADRLMGSAGAGVDTGLLHRALEALAVALVERNAQEVSYDEVPRLLDGVVNAADAPGVMQALINADLLRRSGDQVRFPYQLLREYYAARVLTRIDEEVLLGEYALKFRWREPLLVMLGFAGAPPERTRRLIEVAQDVDPVFTAQLLRACLEMPRQADRGFVARQLTTLRTPEMGTVTWETAARGLMELGSAGARAALLTVVDQAEVAMPARCVALVALVQLTLREKAPGDRRDEAYAGLIRTLAGLLRPDTPEPLLSETVKAVGEARLTALGLAIGDLIDPGRAWPVVDSAHEALRRLGMVPGEARERAYLAARETRLNSIEATLPQTADRARIVRLSGERLAHLEWMYAAGRLDLLLPRRFSIGIANDMFWTMWLRPSRRWGVPAGQEAAWGVLRGGLDGPELIRHWVEGDDLAAVAAAHQIVEGHLGYAAELLANTGPDASPHRLLAAARVAGRVGGPEEWLRPLIREVAEIVDASRIEALTALVAALPSRSAVVASAAVVRRLSERGRLELLQGWPWFQLWTDLPFDEKMCTDLLLAGLDDHIAAAVLWLNADISGGALLDAGEVDAFRLPDEARATLLSRMPAPDAHAALPAFLGACVKAGVGTPELLRSACATARRDDVDWPVHAMSSTAYGSVEQSLLADVLARIGFLARRAYRTGDREGALVAYALLSGPPPAGSHPSVDRGRLAGLAVLGDWPAVLTGLGAADPVRHQIARNAVLTWLRGPFTPTGFGEYADVARWLADRLNATRVEPAVRDTLLAIKSVVERRLEGYIAVGSDRPS
jgi:Ternary complex associated domain 9